MVFHVKSVRVVSKSGNREENRKSGGNVEKDLVAQLARHFTGLCGEVTAVNGLYEVAMVIGSVCGEVSRGHDSRIE